jgi:hypothetical protein
VVASDDDLEDTIGRLAELVQWMDELALPAAS